jgi:hypothetical protein
MKLPIWWLKNTRPPSMDRCCTPKICAMVALVGGTVDSHSMPITAENTYTDIGEIGTSRKTTMTTERAI